MRINFSLSRKVDNNGRCEVMIRLFEGSRVNLRAKSGISVNPDFFEYKIDRTKCDKDGISVPVKSETLTTSEALKKGIYLRDCGEIVIRQKIYTDEVLYHKSAKAKLDKLVIDVTMAYGNTDNNAINGDWFKNEIFKSLYPDEFRKQEEAKAKETKNVYTLINQYLKENNFSYDHTKAIMVLARDIARYEGYVQYMANKGEDERKGFTFDVDAITREDIIDFFDYLRNEYYLSKEYPKLFKHLLASYPVGIRSGKTELVVRGENSLIKLRKKLKAFFNWLLDTGKTKNRPFDGVKIGSEKYGTPFYLSIDERNQVAEYDFSNNKALEVQRDIFIFHCLIGCRVSDLLNLKQSNISDGLLTYVPHKTKDESDAPVTATIPLHPKAIAILERYKGKDRKGRILPFICAQKYNEAIKKILRIAGINRIVEVRNPKTGETEYFPLCEVASTHTARKTFIGNCYFKAPDPNIVGKMSGHVEGSKAFARYRNIEDETLKNVINLIG